MENWEQLADFISVSKGQEMDFLIERAKPDETKDSNAQRETLNLKVTASLDFEELAAVQGEKNDRYRIGISQSFVREKVGIYEAMTDGTRHVWGITVMTLRGIKGMIQGAISPKHIAGPIFIFSTAAKSAKKGIEYLISFVIFLSVSLAILNLLPIPVLDGGHIVFFTIEAIIGRPLSLKVQQIATQIGVAFLLLLTLFAVSNDIRRLFEGFVV